MSVVKNSTILVAFVLSAISARADDVRLSTSQIQDISARPNIVTMLGQENTLLRRLSAKRLEEITTPVKPSPGITSIFGGKVTIPGTFPYTEAMIDRMPAASGGQQWQCLTEALYFEARGESLKGQFAVAEVILNRVDTAKFPGTICSVVNQGAYPGRINSCQFSYKCDGIPETIHEYGAYGRLAKIARIMMDGGPRSLTRGATYYHANTVNPSWARAFTRTARIGDHYFYSEPRRLSSN